MELGAGLSGLRTRAPQLSPMTRGVSGLWWGSFQLHMGRHESVRWALIAATRSDRGSLPSMKGSA